MTRRTKKDIDKELRTCHKQYERAKEQIQQIGFICKGSITERRLTCGNPNCRCHKDPKKRHGPYYQLSWKEKGKTASHFLSPEDLRIYRKWMDNRRMLMDLIDEMESISQKAGDCVRAMNRPKSKARKKPNRTAKNPS